MHKALLETHYVDYVSMVRSGILKYFPPFIYFSKFLGKDRFKTLNINNKMME